MCNIFILLSLQNASFVHQMKKKWIKSKASNSLMVKLILLPFLSIFLHFQRYSYKLMCYVWQLCLLFLSFLDALEKIEDELLNEDIINRSVHISLHICGAVKKVSTLKFCIMMFMQITKCFSKLIILYISLTKSLES